MAVKRKELSAEEVSQRTAVLRRFKELLKAQRDRFRNYIEILDKQKSTIEHGSADELIRHVELEEKIVADIFSIQKVIDPMEEMYQAARVIGPAMPAPLEADNVDSLKSALEGLKAEAISRSERNKNLLSKRMIELRAEIKNIRANPYARQRTAYSDSAAPTLVDIRG
jgi:hypothetical protein